MKSKHKGSSSFSFAPTSYVELGDDSIPNSNFVDLERPPEGRPKGSENKDFENESSSLCTMLQEMEE